MDWTKESLTAKSRIFFEKAFSEDREDIFFGLYCSMGLELLERAAVASVSPTLLAEQDELQGHILYALGNAAGSVEPKSIITAKVIALCEKLIPEFDKECKNISMGLTKRRNAEVHSGALAFKEYNSDQWLSGFFQTSNVLAKFLGITLSDLFDKNVSQEAEEVLKGDYEELVKKVNKAIAAHKEVYKNNLENKKEQVESEIKKNDIEVAWASHHGFHDVTCPSCGNKGTIFGQNFAKERKNLREDDCIEIVQHITATTFNCNVCGLKLNSNQELKIANLPLHYNRKMFYSPEDYYGLSDFENQYADEMMWENYSND